MASVCFLGCGGGSDDSSTEDAIEEMQEAAEDAIEEVGEAAEEAIEEVGEAGEEAAEEASTTSAPAE